ncbi:hypothetical protein [Neoasaia chiangmaiensis]|uniref:Uncharacterized protein n=1 Tax=Neoasaia chiangmaiensis TaxID=320497 RepID=A0A1U9KQ33_9PROT|nr:hypothetical protein [Neoasaia chiangmaiensis]AQS87895.1 hypothetical protein A0U93_08030 [Neoasaia chiangmaiensis]
MTDQPVSTRVPEGRWDLLEGVTLDGRPVTTLYDRWMPVSSVPLSRDVTCVLLRDADSDRLSLWYLDAGRAYLGPHIEALNRISADDVLAPVAPALAELAQYSLAGRPQTPIAPVPPMPALLAEQLAGAWAVRNLHAVSIVPISRAEADGTLSGPGGLVLDDRNMRRLLDSRVGEGPLVVASPFDAAPLRAQTIIETAGLTIHRFYAADQDAAFYLIWPVSRTDDQKPAFYCPRAQLIVSDQPQAGLLPGRILAWYLMHPDHVRDIEEATDFQATDYGLGRASGLMDISDAPETPEVPVQAVRSQSEAWSFLAASAAGKPARLPDDPPPRQEKTGETTAAPSGLFKRLRAFMKRD